MVFCSVYNEGQINISQTVESDCCCYQLNIYPPKNIDIILFGNHSSQKTSSSKTHILNWFCHVCVYLALCYLCVFLEASSNVLLYICQEAWLGGHSLHYLYKTAPSLLIHQMKQQNDKISLTKPPHCQLISATG